MFGIPIEGPTNVFCDSEAVTKNAIHPESTLKKKHNSIAYCRTREAVAASSIRVTKEDGKTNLADALMKLLPCDRVLLSWSRPALPSLLSFPTISMLHLASVHSPI